jgi:toxin ParE1/3/4
MADKFFRLRPKADDDLIEIYQFTAKEWGFLQAENYIRDLHQTFLTLAENNRIGRDCGHVRPLLRAHTVGSHVIFYKPTDYGAAIIRVLHKTMDYHSHL